MLFLFIWTTLFLAVCVFCAGHRAAGLAGNSPECECRDRVPVHIATGEHVADLCTGCGRQIYMARYVFRGQ